MSDFVWTLRHTTELLTKTWRVDGTIQAYADPMRFVGLERKVANLRDLSKLLSELEDDPYTCIIRGRYKGFEHSLSVEPTDSKKGRVLRRKSVHEDVPHFYMMADIDGYEPFDYDPMLEPVESVLEFVRLNMPECFQGASFHWQLSSSAGHPSKGLNRLKAHVWFWLGTAYTSSQLRTWAKAIDLKVDKSLFDTIQIHYTAGPTFDRGVRNPFKHRSGFYEGDFGDTVNLVIPDDILSAAPDIGSSVSRSEKIATTHDADPIVTILSEKKMVKGKRPDGGLNIICPRQSEHTGPSGDSATIYYPAYTGGHREGAFVCLHDHCREVPKSIFLDALGYDDADNVFDAVADEPVKIEFPTAKHLCTDQANANRLLEFCNGKLLVVGDRWHGWNGIHWNPSDGDALKHGFNLSKIVLKEADRWEAKKAKNQDELKRNQDVAEALQKWSTKCEMKHTIESAITIVKKVLSVEPEEVDRHPYLLNCTNGTIDLRTGELLPHDYANYITMAARVNYNPGADTRFWENFVAQITGEDHLPTRPVAAFLKRWFGYCMTGSTAEQAFVVHWGNGRNGKSTLIDAISSVAGNYAGVAAPGLLMSSDKGRHPTEIADLFGKRMVTASESGEGGILREDFIKQATGGDRLKARYMRKDFFEFAPTHKLQLLTNHKPTIKGQDEGIWRRVKLVAYQSRFGTAEEVAAGLATHLRDLNLLEKLKGHQEAILLWLVEGAIEYLRDGLNPPDAVIAASKDYKTEQDRVQQFVTEDCELGIEFETYLTNGDHAGIYPSYVRWCRVGGIYPLSKANFVNGLERVVPGFRKGEKLIGERSHRRKVTLIRGVRCLSDVEILD